ncbi:(R)-mandelonitrile beta-glucosyltransferase-like [Corylus avellana]|uniref:(R)-mandelonitrile beta-glucosyltransferase-like n=1 Tax=Corylus avellana TaxID=13451 RepID=UPI00286C37FC|nr:(R)-mandelonitrile beta-glucosyltransferase-like [Corylus avellana]
MNLKISTEREEMEGADQKPHAVCVAAPSQSHIKAMLKFSKLLHHKGFHITFVNTEFNHQRFLRSRGSNSLDGIPDFRFVTIPDSLPPSDPNATQDVAVLCDSSMKNFLAPFSDLLRKLHNTENNPPVTCIVSDGFMAFTVTAAHELGIPIAMLFTVSACSLMAFTHFSHLRDKGFTPLKDESYLTNGYLDTVIDWIPGMRDIRLRDLPSFIQTTDPNDVMFKFVVEAVERAAKASAIVVQTFDALEHEVLDALYPMFPRLYAIGPLQLLLNHSHNDPLKSIGYSLWVEETECLHWLSSKAPNSVLYVNFGSITVMTPQQLIEFGWGLANSKHPFLWVIRPDLVVGESAILPLEFNVETKERGLIASWCPQEEVLDHPSIGGFLTHCGWNSTIESMTAAVPMLCWPFFADQQTNSKYTCNEWGIGMEIDNRANREEVEKIVRELMEGDKGKKMRKKVMEWKKLAEEASGPHGSSSINLNNLVNEVLL